MIDIQYIALIESYRNNSLNDVKNHTVLFLNMISDMDRILATNENFLLGKWINAAKFLGATSEEKKHLEYNARNQVTLWGPNGEIDNYGMKQWSGLVKDYIYPRWKRFLFELIKAMDNGTPLNEDAVRERIRKEIELPFNNSTKQYSDKPKGIAVEVAQKIIDRYSNVHIDQKWLDEYIVKN